MLKQLLMSATNTPLDCGCGPESVLCRHVLTVSDAESVTAGAGEAAEDHVRRARLQQGLADGLLRPGQGPDQGRRRETQLSREKVRGVLRPGQGLN